MKKLITPEELLEQSLDNERSINSIIKAIKFSNTELIDYIIERGSKLGYNYWDMDLQTLIDIRKEINK